MGFSPCGQLVAAGSSDPRLSSVLLLNALTWKRVVEFPMTSTVHVGGAGGAAAADNEKEKRKGVNNNNNNNKRNYDSFHPHAVVYKEVNKSVTECVPYECVRLR